MVAKSPLLRTLILSPYISLERLKISSPSLVVLIINAAGRGVDEKEIEIDAPNLEHYRYSVAKGKTAATPIFINTARLQVAVLSKCLSARAPMRQANSMGRKSSMLHKFPEEMLAALPR
ncbi:hypothetical protein V6N13_023827 [Hibiscus sabdariffa]